MMNNGDNKRLLFAHEKYKRTSIQTSALKLSNVAKEVHALSSAI